MMYRSFNQRPQAADDIAYYLLLVLTVSLWLALGGWLGLNSVGLAIILVSAGKGLVIIFQFMDIFRAPRSMQVIMCFWLLVVSAGISYFVL